MFVLRLFFLCFFLKFFLILRAKSGRKSFFRSPAAFSDEVVVYFFRRRRARPTASVRMRTRNFFMGHSRFSFLVRKK